MGTRGAVHEHGIGAGDGHLEGTDRGLAVLVGDVPAVNPSLQRHAGVVGAALRSGVVARAELELHDVAHGCRQHVGHEHILLSADHHGDGASGGRGRLVLGLRSSGLPVVDGGPRARDDGRRGEEESVEEVHGDLIDGCGGLQDLRSNVIK